MNVAEFIRLVTDNQSLLEDRHSNIGNSHCGCPLWVAIMAVGEMNAIDEYLHFRHDGMPCNPSPWDAAEALALPTPFTFGVCLVWDGRVSAVLTEIIENPADCQLYFAGILATLPFTHEKRHPQLMAGASETLRKS